MPAQRIGAAAAGSSFSGIFYHKPVADDDFLGITSVGDFPVVAVDPVVGEDGSFLAILFEPGTAGGAFATRIHQAPDADQIAGPEVSNFRPNGCDFPDDFMSGNDGILGHPPVIIDKVNIGVADTAITDLDSDIIRAGFPRFILPGSWSRPLGLRCVGLDGVDFVVWHTLRSGKFRVCQILAAGFIWTGQGIFI